MSRNMDLYATLILIGLAVGLPPQFFILGAFDGRAPVHGLTFYALVFLTLFSTFLQPRLRSRLGPTISLREILRCKKEELPPVQGTFADTIAVIALMIGAASMAILGFVTVVSMIRSGP